MVTRTSCKQVKYLIYQDSHGTVQAESEGKFLTGDLIRNYSGSSGVWAA